MVACNALLRSPEWPPSALIVTSLSKTATAGQIAVLAFVFDDGARRTHLR